MPPYYHLVYANVGGQTMALYRTPDPLGAQEIVDAILQAKEKRTQAAA